MECEEQVNGGTKGKDVCQFGSRIVIFMSSPLWRYLLASEQS